MTLIYKKIRKFAVGSAFGVQPMAGLDEFENQYKGNTANNAFAPKSVGQSAFSALPPTLSRPRAKTIQTKTTGLQGISTTLSKPIRPIATNIPTKTIGIQGMNGPEVIKSFKPTTPVTGGSAPPKFNVAGGLAAAGMAADVAGSALIGNIDKDNDATTYTAGDTAKQIGGSALKGASFGAGIGTAVIPIPVIGTLIGAAAGAVIGGVVGAFKSGKARRKSRVARRKQGRKLRAKADFDARGNLSRQDSDLIGSSSPTSTTESTTPQAFSGYGFNKKGGSFRFTLKESKAENRLKVIKADILIEPIKISTKFKKGGKVKIHENIIPNGVLHEEFNELGDKGMPVVKCNLKNNECTKQYEIEKDEMILTKVVTKKIEKLIKDDNDKELGIYVKKQILGNTHSFTDKFSDLNKYKEKNETIFA